MMTMNTITSTIMMIPIQDRRSVMCRTMTSSIRIRLGDAGYTGMCKHVAAMLLLFLDQPERFRGFKRSDVTSPILSDYMRALDAKNDNTGHSAQLDVLKRIVDAKSRLADEQRGVITQGATKTKRKRGSIIVKPGSVRLEPTLIMNRELWSLTLKIGCGDVSYIIKSISKFVANMHDEAYVSYGQKLSFTHTPDMLEPFSLQLFRFLQGVVGSRVAVQLQTTTITRQTCVSNVKSCLPMGNCAIC